MTSQPLPRVAVRAAMVAPRRRALRGGKGRAARGIFALWFVVAPHAFAQSVPMPAPAKPPSPPPSGTSVVFDKEAANAARQRNDPSYIERIFVEGRDPDAPRAPRKPLEKRFADTLLAPPAAAAVGMRPLDTTPCMSLASTWNSIGSNFVPTSGCPR